MIANRYERIEELGHGGMGTVYKVKDRLTRDTVALKQVSILPSTSQFNADSETNNNKLYIALTREFQTLAGLRHPNIISVLDYGYDEQRQPFYTMEYIKDRTDIRQISESINLKDKVNLLIQLLQGLAYLHRRQVIHRDLKPANIMVVDNKVKVLDFGLAVIQQGIDTTQDNLITGTIAYMAPELLHKQDATIATDLYAVGVIAYQMFTGRYPFDTRSPRRLMTAILKDIPDVWTIGLPEELALILGRLLAKTPNERYSNATQVIQSLYRAIGEDAPPESSDIRQSYLQAAEFVGREQELGQLEQSLKQAMAGQGTTWLVAGESGIGKSRLLDELRIRALVKGAVVLRGQGVEGGGVPFQLWRDITRHLVLSTPINQLEKSILKEIVPDIETLLGETIPDAPSLTAKNRIQRITLTLVDLMKRQDKPLVLLLEDLQWAVESLDAINYLNTSISELPLLVVGNYRNDEAPKLPEELPDIQIMSLSRLDEHEITALSVSMLGDTGKQPHVLDILKQETEGNCFFMVEVVQALAEEAGRLADIGRMTLPDYIFVGGIRQVVRRRLDRIPLWGRDLLNLVALAGRQLDLQIIQFIIDQQPQLLDSTYSLEDWLRICTECTVLEMQDQKWRFSHDKLRESVLHNLSDDSKPSIHRIIALAIETIYPENPDYNEILLNHWQQVGNPEKELYYIALVVENFITSTRMNYVRASQLLEHGLDLLPADDARRIKFLNWQSQSKSTQGDHALSNKLAKQALKLARNMQDEKGIADSLTNLGGTAGNQNDHLKARDYHLKALAIYQQLDDQLGIANSYNNLGVTSFSINEQQQAEDYFQKSLLLYEQLEDKRNIASLLNNLANVYDAMGDFQKSIEYQHQGLTLVEQLGDHLGLAIAYNNLGISELDQGNYAEAKDYNLKSYAIFKQISHPLGTASSLSNLGKIAYENRNYRQAETYQKQSLAIRQQLNHKSGIAICLNELGNIAYAKGDGAQALDYLQQSLDISQSIHDERDTIKTLNDMGLIAYQHGDMDKARVLYQQALTVAQENKSKPSIIKTLTSIVFVYLKQQDTRAQHTLMNTLMTAYTSQLTQSLLILLVGCAWLHLRQGNAKDGATLIGLVQAHPLKTHYIQFRIDEVLSQFTGIIDPIEIKVALQRGANLDLDTVVNNLLEVFTTNANL